MKTTDRGSGEGSLQSTWRALGSRLAVAAGSLAALISLFHHVPVSTAALRGGGAYFAVLVISKLGLAALQLALAFELGDQNDEETSPRSGA